jgi:hypothetical protein
MRTGRWELGTCGVDFLMWYCSGGEIAEGIVRVYIVELMDETW